MTPAMPYAEEDDGYMPPSLAEILPRVIEQIYERFNERMTEGADG